MKTYVFCCIGIGFGHLPIERCLQDFLFSKTTQVLLVSSQ
uniref:Uncharacterized protein n=1 Tax=Rhizophora mucronata TaxID=61149 RepID=A0A2P2M124_RHIMU